jgi:hypothetical protein
MLIPTLIANGFVPEQVHRRPTYLAVGYSRTDEFGARVPYVIALAESTLSGGEAASLAAWSRTATPIEPKSSAIFSHPDRVGDTVSSTTVGGVMDRRIVARSDSHRAGSAQSAAAWSRSGTRE